MAIFKVAVKATCHFILFYLLGQGYVRFDR